MQGRLGYSLWVFGEKDALTLRDMLRCYGLDGASDAVQCQMVDSEVRLRDGM